MRSKLIKYPASIILTISSVIAFALIARGQSKEYVEAPSALISVAVVAQPDCDLKIDEVQPVIRTKDKKPLVRFHVHNLGNEAVRFFAVEFKLVRQYAFPASPSLGFEDGFGQQIGGIDLLAPGGSFWNIQDEQVGPANMSLAESLVKPSGGAVWIGIVTEVKWADGRVFSARAQSDGISRAVRSKLK